MTELLGCDFPAPSRGTTVFLGAPHTTQVNVLVQSPAPGFGRGPRKEEEAVSLGWRRARALGRSVTLGMCSRLWDAAAGFSPAGAGLEVALSVPRELQQPGTAFSSPSGGAAGNEVCLKVVVLGDRDAEPLPRSQWLPGRAGWGCDRHSHCWVPASNAGQRSRELGYLWEFMWVCGMAAVQGESKGCLPSGFVVLAAVISSYSIIFVHLCCF